MEQRVVVMSLSHLDLDGGRRSADPAGVDFGREAQRADRLARVRRLGAQVDEHERLEKMGHEFVSSMNQHCGHYHAQKTSMTHVEADEM